MSHHRSYRRLCFSITALLCLPLNHALTAPAAQADDPQAAIHDLILKTVTQQERFWRGLAEKEPSPGTGSRGIFAYAMLLSEAGQHPERLQRLFELAARIQDHDPKSTGYGNIKWYWRDAGVTDANAIEFCMQDALIIWLRHRGWLPEPARKRLQGLLELAIEGCLRHRVPTSYSNIAIFNAANLIVLGETLDRPEVTEEGQRRLDAVCLWTWQFGTHEYCSPTYYCTDLNGLRFIESNARSERAREQAVALLKYFWTDIALNWHPTIQRLCGSQSRSYDYLNGLGALDFQLILSGWLPRPLEPGLDLPQSLMGRWLPPPEFLTLNRGNLPRLVRQRWGITPAESRTSAMYPDISLGTAATTYGTQDVTLAVDLPGPRDAVRCYFIPDGRGDPYGKVKYATGSAKHMKALHLGPFWAAAQRNRDALGLVVYRPEDLKNPPPTDLQSHFVLRRGAEGIWLAGKPVTLEQPAKGDAAQRVPVAFGKPLVLRYGSAAIGIRVLWARTEDGCPAEIALVDDGNSYGAIRLTVEHRATKKTALAAAAFWVRIGTGLNSASDCDHWRRQFDAATPAPIAADEHQIHLTVPGEEGPLSIAATAPYGPGGSMILEPPPTQSALELDGREIGRPILEAVEPIRSQLPRLHLKHPLPVPAGSNVTWEAEDGLVLAGMCVGSDEGASGGHFVWQPKDGRLARLYGSVLWPLNVAQAGRYYLWGRIRAADGDSDSFYLRVTGPGLDRPPAQWNIDHDDTWHWQPVNLTRPRVPTALDLPAGLCILEFRKRETGAKIDRLFLSADPKQTPK
jgi:hypothetical protein